jgi:hypothetical protein
MKISYDPKWAIAYEAEEVFPWEIIGIAICKSTPTPYTILMKKSCAFHNVYSI